MLSPDRTLVSDPQLHTAGDYEDTCTFMRVHALLGDISVCLLSVLPAVRPTLIKKNGRQIFPEWNNFSVCSAHNG